MGKTVEKQLACAADRAKEAVHDMTDVFQDFQKRHCGKNALLVRKKFAVKDVCFRKNQPDAELFRWELAFDVEAYLFWLMLAGAGLWLTWKITRHKKRTRKLSDSHT